MLWDYLRKINKEDKTIILTTHYIREAEEMADRIGVINKGSLVVVEDKNTLMKKLGKKQLVLQLNDKLSYIPDELSHYAIEISDTGKELIYTYDTQENKTGITRLLQQVRDSGIKFNDLHTNESSLEEIFKSLVRESR